MARPQQLAEPVLRRESGASPPLAIERFQVQRRLKPDGVDGLVARYESGMSVMQLAKGYKINRGTVMDHLRRRRVQTRRNKKKLSNAQMANVVELTSQVRH